MPPMIIRLMLMPYCFQESLIPRLAGERKTQDITTETNNKTMVGTGKLNRDSGIKAAVERKVIKTKFNASGWIDLARRSALEGENANSKSATMEAINAQAIIFKAGLAHCLPLLFSARLRNNKSIKHPI